MVAIPVMVRSECHATPQSIFKDAASRDCQNYLVIRPYRDAQDRLLCRDKICPARTQPIMSLESIYIIIVVITWVSQCIKPKEHVF